VGSNRVKAKRSEQKKKSHSSPFESHDYRDLYRFLRHHLPAQEVEDVIQETYRRFLEADPLVPIRNAQAYLHGIAWKVVCDYRTRRRNEKLRLDLERAADSGEPSRNALPDQLAAEEALEVALSALRPTMREVLVLGRLNGYTKNEIAKRLSLSVHTVKKYMNQAMRHLRNGGDKAL
jgi:RNA polymerase sigma factor (sigma-70 family)